jgi:hypothetical protein
MSLTYPTRLLAVGGARTGIAPVNLLDVQDVNGNTYYWSDRPYNGTVAITGEITPSMAIAPVTAKDGESVAWAYATAQTGECTSNAQFSLGQMGADGTVSGSISMGQVRGGASITFSGFTLPALPTGAKITAVYKVAIMSGLQTNAIFDTPFGVPNGPGFFDGQYSVYSLALTQDPSISFPACTITFSMGESLLMVTVDDYLSVSFVGLAIYYTVDTASASSSTSGTSVSSAGPYVPWLLSVPKFSFHRSLITDSGSFVLQNLSGDTLSRDFEKIMRRSALEGAFFIYRCWQGDAEAAWLEVHGTLSVGDIGEDMVTLKASQLINPATLDTPLEISCETCQWDWGDLRCGSTETTECSYSFQTCQVPERFGGILNHYEKNYGETTANTALTTINRRRVI